MEEEEEEEEEGQEEGGGGGGVKYLPRIIRSWSPWAGLAVRQVGHCCWWRYRDSACHSHLPPASCRALACRSPRAATGAELARQAANKAGELALQTLQQTSSEGQRLAEKCGAVGGVNAQKSLAIYFR